MKPQSQKIRDASLPKKRQLTLARSVIRVLTESEQFKIVAGLQPSTDTCCGNAASSCKSK
jgi:hypothetical protein